MYIIKQLQHLIDTSTAIIIGAGAGLSVSAGFEYDGKTFMNNFEYMNKAYGYKDMYSAGFHNFSNDEMFWGYWSKFIYLNRYKSGALQLYNKLYDIFKNKNYFVITTNVDHQFQKAGFDKNRLYYTQGDYGLFQCNHCKNIFDNKEQILKMIENIDEKTHSIPTSLIPHCPICSNKLTLNLRCDDTFIQNEGFYKAMNNYKQFINDNKGNNILFLELGVGYNTPIIIKYPFMQMTYQNKNAIYVSINVGENDVPFEIKSRSIVINADIKAIINELN